MKKQIALLILLAAGVLLCVGCGAKPTPTTQPPAQTVVPTTAPAIETTAPTEPAAEPYGIMGEALHTDGSSYYWDYAALTLMCRSDSGTQAPIAQSSRCTAFAIANGTVYYNDAGQLFCIDPTGGAPAAELGSGVLMAADDEGEYLICIRDGVLWALNTADHSWTVLADGSFLALHKDIVYFSPRSGMDYEAEQKGKVTLSAVTADGTSWQELCVTAPDLYSYTSGYSSAQIMQIRFSDSAIYFSYGSIAGTGHFFQGGKIMRLGYDGSDATVVAGQDSLVDADFIILEDGSVSTTSETYYVDYPSSLDFVVQKDTLYWFDPLSGKPIDIAQTSEFDSAIACDTWEVSLAQISDGYAFYRVLYKMEDPENSFGWRTAYKTIGSILYRKDLTTGETVILGRTQ